MLWKQKYRTLCKIKTN